MVTRSVDFRGGEVAVQLACQRPLDPLCPLLAVGNKRARRLLCGPRQRVDALRANHLASCSGGGVGEAEGRAGVRERRCGGREVFPRLARLRLAQECGSGLERVVCGGSARGTLYSSQFKNNHLTEM